MPKIAGYWFFATGLLHVGIGVVKLSGPVAEIARAGYFNAVEPHIERSEAFWFFFSGALMLLLGQAYIWIERKLNRRVPAFLGWQMAAIATVGTVLMPASGFFIVIPLGIYIAVADRREPAK